MMFRDKKDEESGELGIFTNLNKTLVIQDAQVFNETPLNPRRCNMILMKLLYLLYQGESFSGKEATMVFFSVTKSFQSKDPNMRRLTYLLIKELSKIAQDVIMVTSSLQQDFVSKVPEIAAFKANAVRALGRVVDASMLPGIERILKQAILDRSPAVSSAALATSIHFSLGGGETRDLIKRWLAEAQQAYTAAAAASGSRSMAQYHGLGLLYLIKQHDRVALSKLVQQFGAGTSGSPATALSTCLMLRVYAQLLASDAQPPMDLKPYLRYKGKSDMVSLEAARIICSFSELYAQDIVYAVTALQMFLSSPKPILRFAAIRTLNELALRSPEKVSTCNVDIEGLVTDSNRNVATLAITTLLKTGNESSVDRLLKQISGYVSEISDEFKVIVVDAVRALCLKFPSKHAAMLDFLGSLLREEGGQEHKEATVSAICELIQQVGPAKESGLLHLCEFIEDCEFPRLTAQVLHVLGEEGPRASSLQPSKFIRYIYNRLILEDGMVRVAAIGALNKFALQVADLRPSIISILRKCAQTDLDDAVRDRAVIALSALEGKSVNSTFSFFLPDRVYDLDVLEERLQDYLEDQSGQAEAFDIAQVPTMPIAVVLEKKRLSMAGHQQQSVAAAASAPLVPESHMDLANRSICNVSEISDFVPFGRLFASNPTLQPLTEAEAEYVVGVRKHLYADGNHLVLEFQIRNTVRELVLENVQVQVRCEVAAAAGATGPPKAISVIPIARLVYDDPASCCVAFEGPTAGWLHGRPDVTFHPSLRFLARECDPDTFEPLEARGTADVYSLEAFDLGLGDYIRPPPSQAVDASTFETAYWSRLGHEVTETLSLTALGSIEEAVKAVKTLLHGAKSVQDGPVRGGSVHVLMLLGSVYPEDGEFAIRCRLAVTSSQPGVTMQMTVRASDAGTSELLLSAIS